MVWSANCPTLTFSKNTVAGMTDIFIIGPGVTPVPLSATVAGLVWLVALCVIERFVEAGPVTVGE